MRAAYYERQGLAGDVLQVGELSDPEPGVGEIRVRITLSGVNPSDTKKRAGWLGSTMPFPRVVPHSDGVGRVDAVGAGVDPARLGERVWVFGAQSYRPFGTAAELTIVPADLAVTMPDAVLDEVGACLGIRGSPHIARCSQTGRSAIRSFSCTACWAGCQASPRSWRVGAGQR